MDLLKAKLATLVVENRTTVALIRELIPAIEATNKAGYLYKDIHAEIHKVIPITMATLNGTLYRIRQSENKPSEANVTPTPASPYSPTPAPAPASSNLTDAEAKQAQRLARRRESLELVNQIEKRKR